MVFSPLISMLCRRYNIQKKFAHWKHRKIALKSSILYGPVRNFQCCQLAKNQPKSHILFNKNGSIGDIYIMNLLNLLLTKTNVRHRYQNIIHYSMCLFLYIHQDTNTYIYLGRLNELPTSLGINAHFYLHRLKLITFFIVFYSVDKRLLICIGNRTDKWKSIPILYLLTVSSQTCSSTLFLTDQFSSVLR